MFTLFYLLMRTCLYKSKFFQFSLLRKVLMRFRLKWTDIAPFLCDPPIREFAVPLWYDKWFCTAPKVAITIHSLFQSLTDESINASLFLDRHTTSFWKLPSCYSPPSLLLISLSLLKPSLKTPQKKSPLVLYNIIMLLLCNRLYR